MNIPSAKNLPIQSFRDLVGPGLAAIPTIGGPLSALWSQWDTNRRFQRVDETLSELRRLLASANFRLLPDELSENDMQILETALQHSQMAHTKEKRKLFALMVANSWIKTPSSPFDERLLFLNALAAFSEHHIRTLTILADAGEQGAVPYSSLRDSVATSFGSNVEKDSLMVPILETLAAQFGFIRRAWGLNDPSAKGTMLMTANLSSEGIARNCNHSITPIGQRFMESLDDKGA